MTELIIRAAKRVVDKDNILIQHEIPPWVKDLWQLWVEQQTKKKIEYDKIRIAKPFKARTTGKNSQNRHLNGHIAQIAHETGNDFDTLKYYFKRKAISRHYPFDTDPDGEVVPWSETRIDTTQAGALIDTIHQIAEEMEIRLTEDPFDIL